VQVGDAEPFLWPVRVYYEDTDAAGVVYYANYLKYMERARTEWLRSIGFEQTDVAREHGVIFVVRSAAIDELQVTVELTKVGAGQIDLVQRVSRGDALLATANVKLVCVGRATMRPTRIPQPLATRIRT
jgi:acyl-CoA thioester hydrolase